MENNKDHSKTITRSDDMKEEIFSNIENPAQLEKLYRENKISFKEEFNKLYPELNGNKVAEFWHLRLNYQEQELYRNKSEIILVILLCIAAAIVSKLPYFLNIDPELFFRRNAGFVFLPFLAIYFSWKNKVSITKSIVVESATILALIFINLFPNDGKSDTLILSCIYLPLFLWSLMGLTFVGDKIHSYEKRIDFLKYNGELVVLNTIILIAGMILTVITLGLFKLIGFDVTVFYQKNIAIPGLAISAIVSTFIIQTNPQLVKRVSPLIAKIFSPLLFITLIIYLIAMIYSGKDPYNDREFLIIFNALLIGVITIIFFSVAEASRSTKNQIQIIILLLLSVVTIIVGGIALSAIVFRISEWGLTPNRLAVLGGNVLILINLLIVTSRLFNTVRKKSDIESVAGSIAAFLPVYSLWTIVVTFIFPIIFRFK